MSNGPNIQRVTLAEMKPLLLKAWCASTATGSGEWSPTIPSLNQCVVTALLVQELFGGELLCCPMTDGDSHYWI